MQKIDRKFIFKDTITNASTTLWNMYRLIKLTITKMSFSRRFMKNRISDTQTTKLLNEIANLSHKRLGANEILSLHKKNNSHLNIEQATVAYF